MDEPFIVTIYLRQCENENFLYWDLGGKCRRTALPSFHFHPVLILYWPLQSHIIVIIKHYLREKGSEKLESRLSLVICFDLHNDYANSSPHNAAMIYSCSIVMRTANESKSKQLPILLVISILALWIIDAFGKQSWMVCLSRADRLGAKDAFLGD